MKDEMEDMRQDKPKDVSHNLEVVEKKIEKNVD